MMFGRIHETYGFPNPVTPSIMSFSISTFVPYPSSPALPINHHDMSRKCSNAYASHLIKKITSFEDKRKIPTRVSPTGSPYRLYSKTRRLRICCIKNHLKRTENDGNSFSSDPASKEKLEKVKRSLEFWFSPSNLRRDWYLRSCMNQYTGFVSVTEIVAFHSMKILGVTVEEIIRAASNSEHLEVDAPGVCIRAKPRIIDVKNSTGMNREGKTRDKSNSKPSGNVTWKVWLDGIETERERSVVIENLPRDFHERKRLRALFGRFGKILYLYVPKTDHPTDLVQNTQAQPIFIEYETVDSAKICEESWQEVISELLELGKQESESQFLNPGSGRARSHEQHSSENAAANETLNNTSFSLNSSYAKIRVVSREKWYQPPFPLNSKSVPEKIPLNILEISGFTSGVDGSQLWNELVRDGKSVKYLTYEDGASSCLVRYKDADCALAMMYEINGASEAFKESEKRLSMGSGNLQGIEIKNMGRKPTLNLENLKQALKRLPGPLLGRSLCGCKNLKARLLTRAEHLSYWEKAMERRETIIIEKHGSSNLIVEPGQKRAGLGLGGNCAQRGLIVRVTGLPHKISFTNLSRRIKEHLGPQEDNIVYVKYERGSRSCLVVFKKPEQAQLFAQLVDEKGLGFHRDIVAGYVLEGVEEENSWHEHWRNKRMKQNDGPKQKGEQVKMRFER